MASARKPCRLKRAMALCTTSTPPLGTCKRSSKGMSASRSRLPGIGGGLKSLEALDDIEAALDVVEWNAGKLRQFELPPFGAKEPRDDVFGKAEAFDGGRNAGDDGVGRHVL